MRPYQFPTQILNRDYTCKIRATTLIEIKVLKKKLPRTKIRAGPKSLSKKQREKVSAVNSS
jgi:hypothetical protein